MTHRYPTLSLLLLLVAPGALAQNYSIREINNIHARFYSTGAVGQDYVAGVSDFEVPAGAGTHALYAAGL